MLNVLDYLYSRSSSPLSSVPFTPLDNLIMAKLSSFDWSGIVDKGYERPVLLSDAAGKLLSSPDCRKRVKCRDDLSLLSMLQHSARFSRSELIGYCAINDSEAEQFGALTVMLPDGTAFISYRGTDDTISGWREDFEMSFSDEIPSQRDAASYLELTAAFLDCPIMLGGHSKGGNIAVYASASASERISDRITKIYSDDGPGFSEAFIGSDGYKRIVPRICTYVPQSSVIGMLFERTEECHVVKSDSIGLLQHLIYSWQADGDDFVYLDSTDAHSRHLSSAVRGYLKSVSREEREAVIDFIFSVLSSGADRIPELIRPGAIASSVRVLASRSRSERLEAASELSRFIWALIRG